MANAIINEPVATGNAALPINPTAPTGPVLKIVNGRPVVSSLQVAKHFDKRHANVVRHIQAIIRNAPESFSRLNFELAEYEDAQGKPHQTRQVALGPSRVLAPRETGGLFFLTHQNLGAGTG